MSLRSAWDIRRACRPTWRIAHVAFDLGARAPARRPIDHDDVDGVGAHERLADLQCLLAGIGLADKEVFEPDAEVARIGRVHRVLDVDVGGRAARLLRFGHDVLGERALAGGLRPKDFGHAAARDAADAERDIERERAGRDAADRFGRGLAEPITAPRPNCFSICPSASSSAPGPVGVSHVVPSCWTGSPGRNDSIGPGSGCILQPRKQMF